MLRREDPGARRRAGAVQTLALQALLAVVILIAAFFSRDNPTVFWLTIALLGFPVGIGGALVIALVREGRKKRA